MKKIVLLTVCFIKLMPVFAQDYKSLGDAKAAQGDYTGAAAFYELGMQSDDECAIKYFELIYEKKIEAEYADQLYQIILPLAQKGRADAQYYLASMYDQGYGIKKDHEKAMEWYKKAAEQGNEGSIKYLDKIKEEERLAAEQKAKEEDDKRIAEQKAKEEEEQRMAAQKAKEEEEQRMAAQKAKEEEERRMAEQKAKEDAQKATTVAPNKAIPTTTDTNKKIKASFGLKGGLNIAFRYASETIDYTSDLEPFFHLGAFLNIRFGHADKNALRTVGLQPELLYSRMGFRLISTLYEENEYGYPFYWWEEETPCYLDYLTLPIMFKIYIFKGLNIEAGPYLSYLLSVTPESLSIDNGPKMVLSDLQGGLDAGLCFGIGMETKFGLTFGARYTLGLSDLASNLDWRNQILSLSVGWKF